MAPRPEHNRQFVRVDERFMHLRRAGRGPALVMLHQSPQNSRMWLDEFEHLAQRYTVIAPDLPGFGYSQPLPGQPDIGELSTAVHGLLDALGIESCVLFGMHTGAIVAVYMGLQRPGRVAGVVTDGYACFTDEERSLFDERYLPPFEPTWDGGHLRWLWARMREQLFFFPWYEKRAQYALRLPAPSPERTQAMVDDILRCGDHYRAGYRAALGFADRDCVADLTVPARLVYRDDDVLSRHLERLPDRPDHVFAERVADRGELWSVLEAFVDSLDLPEADIEKPKSVMAVDRFIVDTVFGPVAAWRSGSSQWLKSSQSLKLIIHAPGQAPPGLTEHDSDSEYTTVVVELPGHGASVEVSDAPLTVPAMAGALAKVVNAVDPDAPVAIEAHGAATPIAIVLTEELSERARSLHLVRPWLLDDIEIRYFLDHLPDPAIHPAGGHLLEAWQWERERHFFPPWLEPTGGNRRIGDAPSPAVCHDNCVTLIGLGDRLRELFEALLETPGLADRLYRVDCPVTLAFDETDDPHERLTRLQAALAQKELKK